jgi:hypothetical protein
MMNRFMFALASMVLSYTSVASERFNKIDESRLPKEFLDELCSVRVGAYLVEDSIWGWVKPSDVLELMNHIDSNAPCRSVALASSSYIRFNGSTLGDEAAFLIEGFRQCEYPPDNSSKPLSESDRVALKEWWSQADLSECPALEDI